MAATEAGLKSRALSEFCSNQVDRARLDVVRAVERPSGLVALGMPHSLMAVLALPLLKAATQELPEVRIELKQEQSHVLAAAAQCQKLDFAVVAQPRSSAGLASQPLLTEELCLIEPRLKRHKPIGDPISLLKDRGGSMSSQPLATDCAPMSKVNSVPGRCH